jgi:hypothetical protein
LCLLVRCQLTSLSRRYDQRAGDLTKDGMKRGIKDAAAFLVFLSAGILERSFCE